MALSSFLISWSLLRRSFYSEAGIKASWGSSMSCGLSCASAWYLVGILGLCIALSRDSW